MLSLPRAHSISHVSHGLTEIIAFDSTADQERVFIARRKIHSKEYIGWLS